MSQPSLRRAIYSWILLLLLAVGLGWISLRPAGPKHESGLSALVGLLRQDPPEPHHSRRAP